MASNPYFNNFNHAGEQNLFDDLVVESVRMHAHDMIYLPREGKGKDNVLNEYEVNTYNQALDVEFYIKNFDSFEGEGQLLSKFGLEIRDQMTIVLVKRSFNEFIKPYTGNERPFEGDCVFIPMMNTMYRIKYADESANFYTLGKLYFWELTCELIENTNDVFNTGRPEIDNKYKPSGNIEEDPDYDINDFDPVAKNTDIQDEGEFIIDWSEINPWGSET